MCYFFRSFLFGALLFSSAVAGAASSRHRYSECEGGMKAFETSVHALLRNDCRQCHDVGGLGPPHSVADVKHSYAAILAYTNFDDIPNSHFVMKGGSQHCLLYGGNCVSTYDDIKRVVNEWWNQGEKDCPNKGKFFSRPTPVPDALPGGKNWVPVSFHFSEQYVKSNLTLEIEMQAFAMPDRRSGYRFRRPRLRIEGDAVAVEHLRILVNGRLDVGAAVYSEVSGVATSTESPAILSTATAIVLQDKPSGDSLSVSFEVLKPASPLSCHYLADFERDVLPGAERRACFHCHGGGPQSLAGSDKQAVKAFPMALPTDQLCNSFLSRANGRVAGVRTPLVELPLRGKLIHPRCFPETGEVVPLWTDWIEKEKTL